MTRVGYREKSEQKRHVVENRRTKNANFTQAKHP